MLSKTEEERLKSLVTIVQDLPEEGQEALEMYGKGMADMAKKLACKDRKISTHSKGQEVMKKGE